MCALCMCVCMYVSLRGPSGVWLRSVVEFMDEESAMKAIQMFDRMKLMGREIGVREVGCLQLRMLSLKWSV